MQSLPDLIKDMPVWLQYLLAGLVLLATIGFSIKDIIQWVARWRMFKIWPHRESWSGDCPRNSECDQPNVAWTGGAGHRWTQKREMRIDDFFLLDLGKVRVLNEIKLISNENRYPQKYKLLIRANLDAEWENIGEYDTLDVTLPKPRKILEIQWVIIEPFNKIWQDTKMRSAWSIYDIRLTEVRLLGRWWHKVIEEK